MLTLDPRMSDLLFLDTEWANDASRDLVSLALVNSDGSKCLYIERDPLPRAASTFVRSVVYPLLERGSSAAPDAVFGQRLRDYISSFKIPRIHFDGQIDKVQLVHALSGFGELKDAIPSFEPVLVTRNDVLDQLEIYFANNPAAAARRHHAGVDAEALRYAFMEVVG